MIRLVVRTLILAVVAAGAACAAPVADTAIPVDADHPREYIFTDKGAAHLAGEALGPATRSYHGFFVAMHEVLDGWSLRLDDGTLIAQETAADALVHPDRLERRHVLADGSELFETVTLLDRADAFHIRYRGVPAGGFAFTPSVDMRFLWKVVRPTYRVEWVDGVLCVAREDRLDASDGQRHPPWLAVLMPGCDGFDADERCDARSYPKGAARIAMERATPCEPGSLTGRIPPRVDAADLDVLICGGASRDEAAARARELLAELSSRAEQRRSRLDGLLDAAWASTGVPDHDRALAWARVSLDNLVMEQRGLGIYAGFYWFTTYWGRDAFIVLPGAMAGGMDFDTAREVLRSFAAYQDRNPRSERFGRVPNFVTVDQVQYASIDGTWWWIRALDEYWRRSGDHDFARAMMPVVFRACEGALAHAVDEGGFLTHGDGETWMDGGGEANPYSPRGDRAVEAQALFHRGLRVAALLARRFDGEAAGRSGDELARRYDEAARRLRDAFQERFVADGAVADHLDRDGSRDLQHRPNGLLALLVSPELFEDDQRRMIVEENRTHTIMPWGVRSLDAADPDYHPRHLWLDRYYYDEAYHNGDVWLWLSGPWVSALPDAREGFSQTTMLMDEILHGGAVGTLREIRDGDEGPAGKDEFGGATSQAWSLSELLRTVAEDYAGVRLDLRGETPRVEVTPQPPAAWSDLSVKQRAGDRWITVRVRDGEVAVDGVPEGWDLDVTKP